MLRASITIKELIDDNISENLIRGIFHNPKKKVRWSNKIMFGSDYPFLDHNQSIDVIRQLFHVDFPGDEIDIQNFLGYNALNIIPPSYTSPFVMDKNVVSRKNKEFISFQPARKFNDHFLRSILQIFKKEKMTGVTVDLLINDKIKVLLNDMVISLIKGDKALSILLQAELSKVDETTHNQGQYELVSNSAIGSASLLDNMDLKTLEHRNFSFDFTKRNYELLFNELAISEEDFSQKNQEFCKKISDLLS